MRVGVRIIDYRFVQNAVIKASELGVGPVRIGYSRHREIVLGGRRLQLAPSVDLLLPYTNSTLEPLELSAFAALAARYRLGAANSFSARLGALVWGSSSSVGGATGRAAVSVLGQYERRIGTRGAFYGGLEVQGGWYGLGLDHLLFRLGFGRRVGTRSTLSVALLAPVLGAERTTGVLALGYDRGF